MALDHLSLVLEPTTTSPRQKVLLKVLQRTFGTVPDSLKSQKCYFLSCYWSGLQASKKNACLDELYQIMLSDNKNY
jgi:hypothetical protein